ncbi:RloB family protein [Anaerosolibacter sp.]|uniref:RloB family protein n=1 Tax=Anaerosolibacter sp. TaxID=1872527 RepID=UPI0039EE1714
MGRTVLSPQRLAETKKTNIGHVILFCEGKTEKYYFDYFAEIIKKNKYTDVKVEIESANGNAQTVLNFANEFLSIEENNRKFGLYDKYLVFDCDAPPEIQSVITASQSKAELYKLLISNYLFETWLLMHFEDIESKITKRDTYRRLSLHLNQQYSKAHKGKIREIIKTGSIEKAIDNARALEESYSFQGKSIFTNMKEMNPYTNVYQLIEQFLVEMS